MTVGEMIAALRRGLGRKAGLFPVPAMLFKAFCGVTGRAEIYQRLSGSLVADPSALARLGWTPPVATHAGLEALTRTGPASGAPA